MIAPPGRGIPYELLLHEGGTGGFRSFACVAPSANVGVVVLANDTRPVGRLGLRVMRAALG